MNVIEMKNSTSKQSSSNRVFVILVALLFLGSMGGALLYSNGTGTETAAAGLPASKILQQITDAEKERVLFGSAENQYDLYVMLTLNIPKNCGIGCGQAKMAAEQMVSAFDPAVYLLEIQSESDSSDIGVLLESYKDKKNLEVFNQTAIEEFICGNAVYRLDKCVLREMDFGNAYENKTQKNLTGNASESFGGPENGTKETNISGNSSNISENNATGK